MTSDFRKSHIYNRAYVLATSGCHQCPDIIIATLQLEGYPEAAEMLNSANIRADLRRVCDDATPDNIDSLARSIRH